MCINMVTVHNANRASTKAANRVQQVPLGAHAPQQTSNQPQAMQPRVTRTSMS